NGNGAGGAQHAFGWSATGQPDRFPPGLGRSFDVEPRVAYRDPVVRHDAIQFLQRGGEDVRRRFGTVGVVAAGIAVDQLVDLEQLLDVILCVFFLTRTSEHDPFAVIANLPEEFAHLRERAYARKIFFSENFGAIFVEFFAETLDFLRRKKLGQILVGAFADLRA